MSRTPDEIWIVRSGHVFWDTDVTDLCAKLGLSRPSVYKVRSGVQLSAVVIAKALKAAPGLRFEDLFVVVDSEEVRKAGIKYIIGGSTGEDDPNLFSEPIPHDWQTAIDAGMKPEENPRDPDGDEILIFRTPGSDEPLIGHERDGTLHLFDGALRQRAVAAVIRRRWGLDVALVPKKATVLTDTLAEKYREATNV